MSEFWKSLPRKFCEICKCWFADNKASIEFHERGKRHQENVQKRIQEIQKKGMKEHKKKKELENEMDKIEKAALAAYEKDLQHLGQSPCEESKSSSHGIDAKATSNIGMKMKINLTEDTVVPPKKVKEKSKSKKQENKVKPQEPKTWFEAVTDEGYSYYWNSETSESRWEPPEDGYVTIAEQTCESDSKTEKVTQNTSTRSIDIKTYLEVEKEDEESNEYVPSSIGPKPKYDPYGQWTTVENKKPEEVDLQLPKLSEDLVEVFVPVVRDEPKLKFKEKTIGKLEHTDDQSEVIFKKRKFGGSSKRNARQRTTDDD